MTSLPKIHFFPPIAPPWGEPSNFLKWAQSRPVEELNALLAAYELGYQEGESSAAADREIREENS